MRPACERARARACVCRYFHARVIGVRITFGSGQLSNEAHAVAETQTGAYSMRASVAEVLWLVCGGFCQMFRHFEPQPMLRQAETWQHIRFESSGSGDSNAEDTAPKTRTTNAHEVAREAAEHGSTGTTFKIAGKLAFATDFGAKKLCRRPRTSSEWLGA